MNHDTPDNNRATAQRIVATLRLLQDTVPLTRQIVRAGDTLYRNGDRISCLYFVNSGVFKVTTATDDGRERMCAVHFRGDWLGLSAMGNGRYGCEAVAMDTGEAWAIRREDLMTACMRSAELLTLVHQAMGREIARAREAMMTLALPADARVAGFLREWINSMDERGLRTDQIRLPISRAEIGSLLGMKIETVSRAFTRLERAELIRFNECGRRDLQVPHPDALKHYVEQSTERAACPASA